MSKINGRTLTSATLAAGPAHAVGVGNYGPVLTSTATGSKVIKMTIDEPWVMVELKGEAGKVITAPVPLTSFSHTVLAKDEANSKV